MRTAEPAIAQPVKLRANCLSSDAVGHAVRITGDEVGGLYQVTRVDIDATTSQEAVAFGIIVSKQSSTTCVVQTSGVLSGVLSGLTSGKLLFVATNATLSDAPPARPSTGKRLIHAIAYALASDVAIIRPLAPVWVLPE